NDAATFFGDTTGVVVEAGGRDNSAPGVPVATGVLHASDVDSPSTFVAQSNVAESYGTFSITAAGAWTYSLNDASASVQALNNGQQLHDDFAVATADGTTQQIDITIYGQNDSAVITGTSTGSVTEAGGIDNGTPGVPTASGTLHVTDVDSSQTFVAQSN